MERKAIILLIICINGIFTSIMTYSIFLQDKAIIDSFDDDLLKISLYNNYENKFDYLHGLFLIPTGLFFIFILLFLDVPTYFDIYKKLKKDLKNKIKKDLEEFRKRGR